MGTTLTLGHHELGTVTWGTFPTHPSGDPVFDAAVASRLTWVPALGMGYYPVKESDEPYRNDGAQAYWDKYARYADTELGLALTASRACLVREYTHGPLVDVGIGCGQFIEEMHARGSEAYGCDVNPVAVRWLHDRGLWRSPWEHPVDAVTLWDVLEHLPNPSALLAAVRAWAFVSIPVFTDGEAVLASKHFRPDEHRWYWTEAGLIQWMSAQGFECLGCDRRESELGREGIATFVFRRAP